MEEKDNPLLQPENFMSGYQDSIEDLKNRPELVSFEKLCYEVFHTESGKKLMEHLIENYVLKSAAATEHPNFKDLCVWKDGINNFIISLRNNTKSHEQRIKAGAKE